MKSTRRVTATPYPTCMFLKSDHAGSNSRPIDCVGQNSDLLLSPARGLSPGWLNWSFLGLYVLVFALLVGQRLLARGPVRRLVFGINVPLLCVMIVLGVLFFSRTYVLERVHHSVVVSHTAVLREGPERTAKVLLEVHAGLKVRVLNQVGEHVRVRLANGVEGFLLDRRLGRI